jgi:hypothetical protein
MFAVTLGFSNPHGSLGHFQALEQEQERWHHHGVGGITQSNDQSKHVLLRAVRTLKQRESHLKRWKSGLSMGIT